MEKTIKKRRPFYKTLLIFMMLISAVFEVTAQEKTVMVKRGETFESIAKKHGITVDALRAANPTADYCHVGAILNVPLPPPPPKVEYTPSYSYTPAPVVKKKGNGFWNVLGLLACASIATMQSTTNSYPNRNNTYRTPLPTYNGNGSAYVAQIQARTDQQMADLNRRVQQMSQNAVIEAQKYNQRSLNATMALTSWETDFKRQNGREPYESEKDQWMQQNYPDVYTYYIQGKYSSYSNSGSSSSSQGGSIRENNNQYWEDKKTSKDCPMCVGNGEPAGQCHFCIKGYRDSGFGLSQTRCTSCKTQPGVCEYCHGTGKR